MIKARERLLLQRKVSEYFFRSIQEITQRIAGGSGILPPAVVARRVFGKSTESTLNQSRNRLAKLLDIQFGLLKCPVDSYLHGLVAECAQDLSADGQPLEQRNRHVGHEIQ